MNKSYELLIVLIMFIIIIYICFPGQQDHKTYNIDNILDRNYYKEKHNKEREQEIKQKIKQEIEEQKIYQTINQSRDIKVKQKIKYVYKVINEIRDIYIDMWGDDNIGNDFEIVESVTSTYVENKKTIYLLLWDDKTNDLYDNNTILAAAIHELAHIMCDDISADVHGDTHTPKFDSIESKLLDIGEKYGYYDGNVESDISYPCYTPLT